MLTLIVENERGERLDLSPFAVYDDKDIGYMITDAGGLSPAANSVGTAEYANFDGVIVSNIRTEKRNIVLTINLARDIEKSRMNLYRYFMPKKITRLYLGIGGKSLYIDGYVETFECSLFSDAETAVISLICPDPYFKAEKEYTLSVRDTTALFEFPFSIPMEGIVFSEKGTLGKSADITGGNAESGIVFEVTAIKTYDTFFLERTLIFENKTTGAKMTISGIRLHTGEKLQINTFAGYKTIRVLRNDGTCENALNLLTGDWISISPGINNIEVYDSDDTEYEKINKLEIKAQAYEYYAGV